MPKKYFSLIILLGLICVGCRLIPSEVPDAEQIGDMVETGKSAAATAQVVASTAAANASDTATRLADNGIDVQTAATKAVGLGQVAATRLREDGPSAIATIKAFGTPVVTLGQKLAQTRADSNGNIFVTVTEAELTTALTWYKPAESDGMQNVYVQIEDGMIILFADVTKPISGRLGAVFEPTLIDGKVQLRITSASMGGVDVPRFVLNSAESRLNNTLLAGIAIVPGNVTYTNLSATNGVLTLSGTK